MVHGMQIQYPLFINSQKHRNEGDGEHVYFVGGVAGSGSGIGRNGSHVTGQEKWIFHRVTPIQIQSKYIII